jgi:hypothetical protein
LVQPTATHDVEDVHETPARLPGTGPLPKEVTGFHVLPDRTSANPEGEPPPTARHQEAVTHEIPLKAAESKPAGSGRGVKLHVELLKVAANGSG